MAGNKLCFLVFSATILLTWRTVATSINGRHGTRQADGTIKCLSCSQITKPHDCTREITCSANEECYTDFYITDQAHVFYDLGCRSKDTCSVLTNPTNPGKRHMHPSQAKRQQVNKAVSVCEECCDDGPLCNIRGCYNNNPNETLCLACTQVSSPESCSTISTCQHGQMCFIQEKLTEDLRLRYELGCERKHICDLVTDNSDPSTTCVSCCDSNLCNIRCETKPTSPSPSTTGTPPTLIGGIPTLTTQPPKTSDMVDKTTDSVTVTTETPMPMVSTDTITMAATATPKSTLCQVCNGIDCLTNPNSSHTCTGTTPFCMTIVDSDGTGAVSFTKKCASDNECRTLWWNESSDDDDCTDMSGSASSNPSLCYYCCVKDDCNSALYPEQDSLYKPPT